MNAQLMLLGVPFFFRGDPRLQFFPAVPEGLITHAEEFRGFCDHAVCLRHRLPEKPLFEFLKIDPLVGQVKIERFRRLEVPEFTLYVLEPDGFVVGHEYRPLYR